MKGTITKGLLLLSVTLCAVYAASTRKQSNLPSWVDCTSNQDCAPGYCCTIGFDKFSYPRCQQLNGEGESCRPSGPLITNGSRYYPDGLEIVLDTVYMMFCPCAEGLSCERNEGGVCRDAGRVNLAGQHGAGSKDD